MEVKTTKERKLPKAKNFVSYGNGFIKFIKDLIEEPSLNLGCGVFKIGTVNADVDSGCSPDVAFDLEKFPYPFEDGSFNTILMLEVLEHLENTKGVISECERLLKDGGRLIITVPHPRSKYYRIDEHVKFFTENDLVEHLKGFNVKFSNYRGDSRNIPAFLALVLGRVIPNKIVCTAEKI